MQDALEEVAFENVGLSIRACQALAELLTKLGHLRTLHFRNNMSDDDGAIALAQVWSPITVMVALPWHMSMSMSTALVVCGKVSAVSGTNAYIQACGSREHTVTAQPTFKDHRTLITEPLPLNLAVLAP